MLSHELKRADEVVVALDYLGLLRRCYGLRLLVQLRLPHRQSSNELKLVLDCVCIVGG